MLLAIDTATQTMSLALHDHAEIVLEETWHTSNNHTVELAPAVRAALERAGDPILTAVAVAIGPGTYTGLRVGVALAKAIASARGLPLVGISTFDILAATQPPFPGTLIAVVQAGRSRVVRASFEWNAGYWRTLSEPAVMNWQELLAGIEQKALITGEVDDNGREAIREAQARGVNVTLAPAAHRLRRAGFLAEEAWLRLEDKQANHAAASVTPVYVKTKDSP